MELIDGEWVQYPVDLSGTIMYLRFGPTCTVGFYGNSALVDLMNQGGDLTSCMSSGSLGDDEDIKWAAFSYDFNNPGLVERSEVYTYCGEDVIP